MKITDYEKVQELAASNIFLLDGPNGTKTIAADALAKALIGLLSSKDFIGGVNLSELTQIKELVSGYKLLIGTMDGNITVSCHNCLESVSAQHGVQFQRDRKVNFFFNLTVDPNGSPIHSTMSCVNNNHRRRRIRSKCWLGLMNTEKDSD